MALKAISLVGLSDTSGERHGRWYIALHVAFVDMVLRDVAMSKSTSATCAYPSVPSFVASTRITDSCIADAMQWCKALRRTIVKGLQHKPTAQKRPKPVVEIPARPAQEASAGHRTRTCEGRAADQDTKAEEDGSLGVSDQ
jgi:hypothetical protein